jgi:glutamate:Na+ symporter, ESS family
MPDVISLSALPSLLAGCLLLLLGGVLAERVPVLARFSIPAPIIGGLLFAVAALLVESAGGPHLVLDTSPKAALLLLFFASIGLTADFSVLRRGSTHLLRFLVALFPFLLAQNVLGVVSASLLGLHPVLGLVAGSITLTGGHGTGAAYADRFAAEYNILGIMGLTMMSATIGLVLGGVIGGPVASWLVRRAGGAPAPRAATAGVMTGPVTNPVTTLSLVGVLAAGLPAVIAGQWLAAAVQGAGVTVPEFLWCLVVGLLIRNGGALAGIRLNDAAAELMGSFCLSVFLVWTMMTLDLRSVISLAGPLLIIIAAQAVLVVAWAVYVVFRLVGRDYEAAVSAGAFCGFAMGATATAIANMQAIVGRYGPAPKSFVVVPIVGAFFVDLMNLAVLTVFLLPGFIIRP